LRSVFLPDAFTRVEAAGSWEHARIAVVLLLWSAAAAALCALTFRWRTIRSGNP
jgi:ABC-2 type transport system permease protein